MSANCLHWLTGGSQELVKNGLRNTWTVPNKLRLYKTIKGSFKIEPYIDFIRNRNQRCSLTRLRISAHSLHIETGRYTRPNSTPVPNRICKYCSDEAIDDEAHFLLSCRTFAYKRACFENKLNTILPNFLNLSDKDKLSTILCPATPTAAKLSNKYIAILFNNRKKLDEGVPLNNLTFPPQVELDLESLSDLSDESEYSFSGDSENDLNLSTASSEVPANSWD